METADQQAARLAELRRDYRRAELNEVSAGPDPIALFQRWFDDAVAAQLPEPNAMTVATASPAGQPSARTVLLKSFDECGFVFYGNYAGQKGRELTANPHVALLFYWAELERQVRITGRAERLPSAESTAYFATRPRGSQLAAWASPQSEPVADRGELEARWQAAERRFDGQDVQMPEHWGGFRVVPTAIEFWQGRPSRLHDRLVFRRTAHAWQRQRLAP